MQCRVCPRPKSLHQGVGGKHQTSTQQYLERKRKEEVRSQENESETKKQKTIAFTTL